MMISNFCLSIQKLKWKSLHKPKINQCSTYKMYATCLTTFKSSECLSYVCSMFHRNLSTLSKPNPSICLLILGEKIFNAIQWKDSFQNIWSLQRTILKGINCCLASKGHKYILFLHFLKLFYYFYFNKYLLT